MIESQCSCIKTTTLVSWILLGHVLLLKIQFSNFKILYLDYSHIIRQIL